ncbi:MAG TPA: hypothetical protein VH475_11525 [Tepidisphaeraceae bacterium]|jgi:hypothetical protein
MSRGYPGRKRATKAYWKGVEAGKRGRRYNPYGNARLKTLFDAGRLRGLATAGQQRGLGGAAMGPVGPRSFKATPRPAAPLPPRRPSQGFRAG